MTEQAKDVEKTGFETEGEAIAPTEVLPPEEKGQAAPPATPQPPPTTEKKARKRKIPAKEPLPLEVQAAIGALEKTLGKGSVMRLGDHIEFGEVKGLITTGSIALDHAIGVYRRTKDRVESGIPKGRTIEIFGPESSGKTTLCNHIIAAAQAEGGLCGMIDMEQAWDRPYAERLGVDPDALIFAQPDCGEEALEILEQLVRTMKFAVLAVDSVASLVPRAELEGTMSDNSMAVQARLMSKALRKLAPVINESNTIVIFTNQLREKVGIVYGNPEVTPGGNALKFYATLRLDMRKSAPLKDKEGNIVGHRARVKVVKNKVSTPFRIAEFDMVYGIGIDKYADLLDCALDLGLIEKRGSWYAMETEQIGQGREGTCVALRENERLCDSLRRTITERYMTE